MEIPQRPPRRRLGCFTQVFIALLLGVVLVLAIDAVFAPWSYYMGGRFHWIPMWQGWGKMHSNVAGGDYLLYVSLTPGRGARGVAHVTGTGILCTPKGETFRMTLGADFEKYMGASTDGKHDYMYMHKRGTFYSSASDPRPELEFHGAWHNPDLVLDDKGTMSRTFSPDATLYESQRRPATRETIPLTLHEGTRSEFDAACETLKHR